MSDRDGSEGKHDLGLHTNIPVFSFPNPGVAACILLLAYLWARCPGRRQGASSEDIWFEFKPASPPATHLFLSHSWAEPSEQTLPWKSSSCRCPHGKESLRIFVSCENDGSFCAGKIRERKGLEVQTGASYLEKCTGSTLFNAYGNKVQANVFSKGEAVWGNGKMFTCTTSFFHWSRNPSEISVLKVKLESFHPQTCKLFLKSVTLKIIH